MCKESKSLYERIEKWDSDRGEYGFYSGKTLQADQLAVISKTIYEGLPDEVRAVENLRESCEALRPDNPPTFDEIHTLIKKRC